VSDLREPPAALVARVRRACRGLPEAYEEPAWVGTRWRIRKRTFAHVLAVSDADGDRTILTFRAGGEELEVLRHSGHPFFFLGWGRNAMGMVLDAASDWTEVRELLCESYCLMAPKKLAAQVAPPPV
jgi:hypothetical protein